ncbi:MAG: hypothetical protein HW409_1125 [candidate division NC10 bacterium]|nr:hypothetical protein [candidate division NC10 bacterium]
MSKRGFATSPGPSRAGLCRRSTCLLTSTIRSDSRSEDEAGAGVGHDEFVGHLFLHSSGESRAAAVHGDQVVRIDFLEGLDHLGDVGLGRGGEMEPLPSRRGPFSRPRRPGPAGLRCEYITEPGVRIPGLVFPACAWCGAGELLLRKKRLRLLKLGSLAVSTLAERHQFRVVGFRLLLIS